MKVRYMFLAVLVAVVVVNLIANIYQTRIETSQIQVNANLIAAIDALRAQVDSLKTQTAGQGSILNYYLSPDYEEPAVYLTAEITE